MMKIEFLAIFVLLMSCSNPESPKKAELTSNASVLNKEPNPDGLDAEKEEGIEADPTPQDDVEIKTISQSIHEALGEGLSEAQKNDLAEILKVQLGDSHETDRENQISVLLDFRRQQNNLQFVAFEDDIKPMMIQSCAVAACHDAAAAERVQVPISSDFTVYPSSRLWGAKMETVAAFANLDPNDQIAISNWINTGLQEAEYEANVKPILDTNCIVCHSNDIPTITDKPFTTYEEVRPFASQMPSFQAFSTQLTAEQQLKFLDWILAGMLKKSPVIGEVNGEFKLMSPELEKFKSVSGFALVKTSDSETEALADDLTEASILLNGIPEDVALQARVYTGSCAEQGGSPYSFGLDENGNPDLFANFTDFQNDLLSVQRKAKLAELSAVRSVLLYEVSAETGEQLVMCADLR